MTTDPNRRTSAANTCAAAIATLWLLHLCASANFAVADEPRKANWDSAIGQPAMNPQVHRSVTLYGVARHGDGAPIENAVIVSAAGGKAVSGADGSFALTVDVPMDAESLGVTVVATINSVNFAANRLVDVPATASQFDIGDVMMEAGGECEPEWVPTFGAVPGVNHHHVFALTVFDDGSGGGPALYVGGWFSTAGAVVANNIARWDGSSWSALGSGMDHRVLALTVFDDGSGGGPALYAGGQFNTAGGASAIRIAKWDGSSWAPLGSGISGGSQPAVNALTVFDDGSGGGPALYAAGRFTTAGGVSANRIAKWDGASWSALGSGMSGPVGALAVFDDGSGGGPALYAGGDFTTAGGVEANRIARWDGSSWSALGTGMDSGVAVLTVFDDGLGGGPALYAGGSFIAAGGVEANRIARWDGSSWSALDTGMNWHVSALIVFDDGSGDGPALYAGGSFWTAGGVEANRIAKWDGLSWSPVGTGMSSHVFALMVFDDAPGSGGGPALYAGGSFTTAGGTLVNRIAKWDGLSWSATGTGMTDVVRALTVFDDGSGGGPALHAGGQFTVVGGVTVNGIAKWNGSTWSPLGSGTNGWVAALTVFDDGSGGGPALYAGGNLTTAGGVPVDRIARWDGSSWSPLGTGVNSTVWALTVFDDGLGGGPALYAGGSFTTAGGVSANHIAKWDGSIWRAVGTGMNDVVYALTVFDDGPGGGPALYAGGRFTTAGGIDANRIAKWNGSSWSPLGSGMSGWVEALTVFDDGSGGGPDLYAGGLFSTAGGVSANYIAKWDGSSWSPVGTGMNYRIFALTVFDDGAGGGPALNAGGKFTLAGGVPASRIAKWDGSSWSPLGSGLAGYHPMVTSLAVCDDCSDGGPALFVGGDFEGSPGGDSHVAKWQGCPTDPDCAPADLNCNGSVGVADLLILLSAWGPCEDCPDTPCPADLDSDCNVGVSDLLILLASWG